MTPGGRRISTLCVGGGISGTAMVVALVRAVQALPAEQQGRVGSLLAVTVMESTGMHGPGLPYGPQAQPFHLMNMESHTVSLLADDEEDFTSWLAGHQAPPSKTESHGAGGFVPRHLFGTYAVQRLAEYVDLGARLGIDVRLAHGTVAELRRVPDGFRAVLDDGSTVAADLLVLASGHWRAEHELLHDAWDPWPAQRLAEAVQRARHIGVIGTSLTAVDTLLTIAHARGQFTPGADERLEYEPTAYRDYRITARSRNGLLPMVRALEGSAAQDGALAGNPFLVKELLPELGETGTEPVTVERVRSRWGEALRWTADRVGNGPPAWSPVLAPERRVAGDRTAQAVKQLLAGLELARRADPCWAAFQSTTRRFFGTLAWYYRVMAQGERSRLLTEFFTPFLSEAGAMPVQNARKIEALMRSGVLRVRAGGPGVVTDAPDMTVNAIGRARAITPGSGIAGQAIAARIVVPDPLGGIRMDPDSGLALDDDGTLVPDVAVLGPLAVGSYLGASGVYASVKFARLVANRWVTEILDTVGQEVRV